LNPAPESLSSTSIRTRQITFLSHGKDIRMDLTLPAVGGIRPAVLVLHGSGGVSDFPEDVCELVNRGYITLAPHYFENTGTSWADLDSIRRHGLTWGQTLLDAVEFATRLPNVDSQSIGLLGFSLGGYLAIAVAAHDRRIKCVAEFFGGVPERFLPSIEHLPPTLILHGQDDEIVPVRHAEELKQLCEKKGFCFEMELYPGAGHNFSGAFMHRAMERAIVFLDQRLQVRQSIHMIHSPA
jgi:carboxymethylenebutenolidase